MSLTRYRILATALVVVSIVVLVASVLLLLDGERGAWIGIAAVAVWAVVLVVSRHVMRRRLR
jgi:drug/metabolite transporter (DMT)-like permease